MSNKFKESKQVVKLMGEFVGGVSHEINNLLMLIEGSAHLILSPNSKTEARKLAHNSLLNKTKKIQESMENLRDILRDTDNDPVKQIEVEQIVKKTINLCQTRFKNHGFKFAVSISENVKIDGQETSLIQSLLLLLNSSHDAIQKEKEKWIKLSVTEDSSDIIIKVIDSGKTLTDSGFISLLKGETLSLNDRPHMGLSLANQIISKNKGSLNYEYHDSFNVLVVRLPKESKPASQIINLKEFEWNEAPREIPLFEQLKKVG